MNEEVNLYLSFWRNMVLFHMHHSIHVSAKRPGEFKIVNDKENKNQTVVVSIEKNVTVAIRKITDF